MSEGIFHGLRVVELATVVAAPSCTTIMADHGAEVIKIECGKGDYWRKFFLEFQPGRDFSTLFEAVNRGKKSVKLNLKEAEGVKILKGILKDADVFVTNVRTDGMKRAEIDFTNLKAEFPHLVYAHLTAYGRDGPDYSLPGYDLGSFFAVTGMAASIHDTGLYMTYPIAVGDLVCGANLVTGISLALRHKLSTGHGQLVGTTLLGSGLSIMAPHIVTAAEEEQPDLAPEYASKAVQHPTYHTYRTKDVQFVAINAFGVEEETVKKLKTAFQVSEVTISVMEACFEAMDSNVASIILERHDIPHFFMDGVIDYDNNTLNSLFYEVNGLASIPGVKEKFALTPFDLSCSNKHFPRSGAPLHGANTEEFLAKGWSSRPEGFNLAPAQEVHKEGMGILHGVTVIELSGFQCAPGTGVSSTCTLLGDKGAHVIKMIPQSGDFWAARDPRIYRQINRNKEIVMLSNDTNVHKYFQKAHVFVTNLPLETLRVMGFDPESLHSRFPHLIISRISPWHDVREGGYTGELGAFWVASGLSGAIAGLPPMYPPSMPAQLGESFASAYLLTGISMALFHQKRTGHGQIVHCSMIRVALWCQMQNMAILQPNPEMAVVTKSPEDLIRRNWPVPTANAFCTKDGYWFQMLGVDMKKHLTKTISALGIGCSLYPKLLATALYQFVFTSGNLFTKIIPVFAVLNEGFDRRIRELTWEECKDLFKRKDVWYAPVNTPARVLKDAQSNHLKMFYRFEDGLFLRAPIDFSLFDEIHHPKLSSESFQ